jgi:hypothetical protein
MEVEYICPSDKVLRFIGIDEDAFWLICELNNQMEEMFLEIG